MFDMVSRLLGIVPGVVGVLARVAVVDLYNRLKHNATAKRRAQMEAAAAAERRRRIAWRVTAVAVLAAVV